MVNGRYFRKHMNPGLKPLFCGDEPCGSGHEYSGFRPYLIIHVIKSGRGVFHSGKRQWLLGPGDAFVIFPDEKHWYRADSEDPWHYFWLAVEADFSPYLTRREVTPGNPVLHTDNTDTLFEYYEQLYNLGKEHQPGEDLILCSLFYRILGNLLSRRSENSGEPAGNLRTDYISAMEAFIGTHYSSSITVSHVADYARLERSYASRIFKKSTGKGIAETIREKRLEKSREFLLEGMSVKEACYSAGFRVYENYLKLFRRVYGMTPSEFRNSR